MTTQQLEREHEQAKDRLRGLMARATTPWSDAETESIKAATLEELRAKEKLQRARGDDDMTSEINRLTGGQATAGRLAGRGSFAHLVANSAFGKFLSDNKGRLSTTGPTWATPPLDIIGFMGGGDQMLAATLTEDPAAGGPLVIADVIPGIVPLPTRPLVVADLFGPGTTSSNTASYMAEKAIVNAAAPVAEGAVKPESSITFERADEPVRKIATWIPVSDEILEDVPGLGGYIDTRLRHFVQLVEDDELLNGSGVVPHFTGIVHRPGLAPPIARAASENNADVILRQIAAIETATQMPVSGITMNPENWSAVLLLKDSTGNYIAGGGPFGSPSRQTLWGRSVAVTPAQAVGKATVGAFKSGAQFRRRSPLRVVASNSHADFFIKNLIALVAEERGALVVFRAAAFGEVTNLATAAPPA